MRTFAGAPVAAVWVPLGCAAIASACLAPVPLEPSADPARLVVLRPVGLGATIAPLMPSQVPYDDALVVAQLDVDFEDLAFRDGDARERALVPISALDARPLPQLRALWDARGQRLAEPPRWIGGFGLPAFSSNRCRALGGCAVSIPAFVGASAAEGAFDPETPSCRRPCPTPDLALPEPQPAADPEPPALPRTTDCGVTRRAALTAMEALPSPVPRCVGVEPDTTPCRAGERRAPSVCRPLSTCAGASWPASAAGEGVGFVNAAAGPGGDGSAASPWNTLEAALGAPTITRVWIRGAVAAPAKLSRAVVLTGVCPAEATLTGTVTVAADVTIAAMQLTGRVVVEAGHALTLRDVALDFVAPSGARLDAERTLLTLASRVADRTARARVHGARIQLGGNADARAWSVGLDARLTLEDVDLDAASARSRLGDVEGGLTLTRARVDGIAGLSGTASATVSLVDVALRGTGTLFDGRGARLRMTRTSVALDSTSGAPAILASDTTLALRDVALQVGGGAALALTNGALEADGVAASSAGLAAAVGLVDVTTRLTDVDLTSASAPALTSLRGALTLAHVFVERADGGSSADADTPNGVTVALDDTPLSATHVIVSGAQPRTWTIRGPVDARLSDAWIVDRRPAEPPLSVEGDERRHAVLWVDGRRDPSGGALRVERLHVRGGFHGLFAELPGGSVALTDVQISASPQRSPGNEAPRQARGLLAEAHTLALERIAVEDRPEYGVTLVARKVGDAKGQLTARDLRIERVGPTLAPRISPCAGVWLPPYALDVDVRGNGPASATLDRIELRSIVGNGLVMRTSEGSSAYAVNDVRLEEVSCRGVDAQAGARVTLATLRATRRGPIEAVRPDDLLNVGEDSALYAVDVDADLVEVRSFARVLHGAELDVARFRAEGTATVVSFSERVDLDRLVATSRRGVREGVAPSALRGMAFVNEPTDEVCAAFERAPALRGVILPPGVPTVERCP